MKKPSGSVRKIGKRWRARITWTDPTTKKKRERRERFDGKSRAQDQLNAWRKQWEITGTIEPGSWSPPSEHTFATLAAHFEERYAKPAEYEDGRKVAGLRSWRTSRGHVRHLLEHLGARPLGEIGWPELDDVRQTLLLGDTHHGKRRSIAYVNRVVATARRMFKIARQRRWIERDPFTEGDPLVETAHERARTRVMTRDEEAAILRACRPRKVRFGSGARRTRLRFVMTVAVETGMRQAEVMALQRWRGAYLEVPNRGGGVSQVPLPWIDWGKRIIHITEFHTKTMKSRIVPMTLRLVRTLRAWERRIPPHQSALFAFVSIRGAWLAALHDAGVSGLTFHDLRHTATTRMIEAGIPESLVSRIVGHEVNGATAGKMTRRYINLYEAAALEQVAKMDAPRREVIN